MKIYPLLILIIYICVAHCDEDNKTDDQDDKDKHTICSACKCHTKTQILDCENISVFDLFTNDEWTSFNESWPDVDYIYFDENGLTVVTVFPEMNVKTLSFNHNSIIAIERQAFKNLQSLRELDLSYNRLTSQALQPEVFEGRYDPDNHEHLRNLVILRLGNNQLHTLHPDLFEHIPNLEYLYLDSNPFMVFDHGSTTAIGSLVNLKFLDMSYMELDILPELLFHSPRQLESLNLTGNLFTTIPEAIGYAINLKYLELDENPFPIFSDFNITLPKLEVLSISFMQPLKSITEGAFKGFPSMKTLICTNNPHLSCIDADIWPPPTHIYLGNNNISTLDYHFAGRWENLEVFDIRMNPWLCDCDNKWFIDTVIPIITEKSPQFLIDIICDYPKPLVGLKLSDKIVTDNLLQCKIKNGYPPRPNGTILIGILVGLLIGIPITLGVALLYRRGCCGFFGPRGPGDYSRTFYTRTELRDDNIF